MMRFIRLAVMAAVGYWIYDTISSYVMGKRHPAPAPARISDPQGHWAGPTSPMTNGHGGGHGAAVQFRDSDGAQRTQMVGRGVIS